MWPFRFKATETALADVGVLPFLCFSSLEFPFLFRLDLLDGTAVEPSSVILLLSAVALTSGSFL